MTAVRWKPAFSWLDVKLGMRMMRKYPGVSLAIVFALAIGILVDEATVDIENIHTHLAHGDTAPRAALNAARETLLPRLLAVLSILAVFVASFFR